MHFSGLAFFRLLVLGLTLPLLFINIKSSHDWGDDFAQYLIQAKNIIEHRPQTENGLLLDEDNAAFAVRAYPVGFPLLISPIYALKGFDVKYYFLLNALLLVITSFFCFEFFRKRTTLFISLLITIVFSYNVHILDIKKAILSEIAFACLLMGILVWIDSEYSKRKYGWVLTGVLVSYLISIRVIGISILIAIIIYELFFRKNREFKKRLTEVAGITAICSILFILLNGFLFSSQAFSLLGFYSNAVGKFGIPFAQNLTLNYHIAGYIFPFFNSWISPAWIIIALAGWLIRTIKSPHIAELFFLIYVLVLLSYPYSDGGVRFLLPILPLLLYYVGYFFHSAFTVIGKYSTWIVSALYLFMMILCIQPLMNVLQSQNTVEQGPYTENARELISFIKSTPENSVVAFCKPRVISLYTGHHATWMSKKEDNSTAHGRFKKHDDLYIVVSKNSPGDEIYDERLLTYCTTYKSELDSVWANKEFLVYKER